MNGNRINTIKELLEGIDNDALDEIIRFASIKKLDHDALHIFEKALQAKFENGKECPLCHGHHIVKNGTHNGVQQYKCKVCGKTFNWKKGTFLENSHLSLSTWIEYISSFIQEKTIRECASSSNISIPASFNCRHRLLHVMNASNHPDKLQGMIEIDDKTSVISYSGNHYKNCPQFEGLTRKSYSRSRKGHRHKDTITDEVIMSMQLLEK